MVSPLAEPVTPPEPLADSSATASTESVTLPTGSLVGAIPGMLTAPKGLTIERKGQRVRIMDSSTGVYQDFEAKNVHRAREFFDFAMQYGEAMIAEDDYSVETVALAAFKAVVELNNGK